MAHALSLLPFLGAGLLAASQIALALSDPAVWQALGLTQGDTHDHL
jgi:hypothetical protein